MIQIAPADTTERTDAAREPPARPRAYRRTSPKDQTMSETANTKYVVTIATGTDRGAGTNAHVSVSLVGTNGTLGPRDLDKQHYNEFESGAVDNYELESSTDYGTITEVIVYLRGDAKTPWQLDYVKVSNKTTGTY